MLLDQTSDGVGREDIVEPSVVENYYRFGLEDVEMIRQNSKGKNTIKTDAETALDLFMDDAATALTSLKDEMLARSMQCALESDDALLQEWAQIDRREQEDRRMALALSKDSSLFSGFSEPSFESIPSSSSVKMGINPSSLERAPVIPLIEASGLLSQTAASGSHSSASLSSRQYKETYECIICTDTIVGIAVKVPCGHYYDKDCLVELFTATMSDESLFPPRCCRQEIPIDHVNAYLEFSIRRLYDEKVQEFSTPVRLYCSNKTCSRFLGPRADSAANINCPACFTSTCALCSDPGHSMSVPCKDDEAAQVVLALGREQGWQRCPGCRQLVELNIGCYHMTCRCRAQFCYLCATRWKKCSCPQWDEGRLFAAAEQRVERIPEAERPNENLFDAVQREALNLRENHHCEHMQFARRPGGGRCERCNLNLRWFLMRCTGCQILMCRRCQMNRV